MGEYKASCNECRWEQDHWTGESAAMGAQAEHHEHTGHTDVVRIKRDEE